MKEAVKAAQSYEAEGRALFSMDLSKLPHGYDQHEQRLTIELPFKAGPIFDKQYEAELREQLGEHDADRALDDAVHQLHRAVVLNVLGKTLK